MYVFRAWYGQQAQLHDGDGNPTHALYGFARMLADLVERRRPRYVGVAFDESLGKGHRQALFPAYKANREPAPPELKRQFALCREWCRLLGLAEYAHAEYEADDLIGTLAHAVRAEGLRVTVVSRDKDLSQLLRAGDKYWDFAAGAEYGYDQLPERFGMAPERMPDYLALMGDASDNIPGVPGIGPKTAAALLQRYDSLEALYDDLPGTADLPVRGAAGLPARLAQHREAAFLARELTRIHCAVPLGANRTHLAPRAPDLPGVESFCARHGFGSLLVRQAGRIAGQAAGHPTMVV